MSFHFRCLEDLIVSVSEAIRPPERLTVSEAAEKYRKLNNPGSYVGDWRNDMAPYLVEPMDVLTSLDYTGMIFVGPARTGKSDMFFNWLTHTAICDPADMMLVHMTQNTARDWSQGDLRKVFRHSPDLGAKVVPGKQNLNTFDVKFTSGMRLLVKWPTITELSGKTVPRLWGMDYDRMPQDVDKEGNPFDLMRKRAGSFRRYGMAAAESSPGFTVENPRWIPASDHEAPPTKGILALYNRGDRRRRYWRCVNPSCRRAFEPEFRHFNYPDSNDLLEAAEMVTLDCPFCQHSYTHDPGPGQPGKLELDQNGKWIKDGQKWEVDGTVSGRAPRSDIASFWLKGPHAIFTNWTALVHRYLLAMEEYDKTGSYEALKSTVNTDQGLPFTPPELMTDRLPEVLKARARDYGKKVVPEGVRFLVTTIDIQKNRFIVQVHGIGLGSDIWIVDRFEIKKSERRDEDGERLWINPGSHLEDWFLLVDQVIEKTYPLSDGSGRRMGSVMTLCDSGGKEGVTVNAYNFWRWLRDEHEGNHHRRFQLIKGTPNQSAPRVHLTYPDSDRKDRKAGARGEVPVLMLNVNQLKDQLNGLLDRTDPLGGRINYPDWLEPSFYTELTVEVKTPKGWENPKRLRNESWDLLVYCLGGLASRNIRIEHLDWENPPTWAAEWDLNDFVFVEEKEAPFKPVKLDESKSLKELAEALG